MIDPVFQYLISMSASLLFLLAGVHKLSNLIEFQGIIDNYRILPVKLTRIAVLLISFSEIALGIGWLISQSVLIPLLSATLLCVYTFSIIVNLVRGRTYIDCGCSFSKFDGLLDRTTTANLSFGLVKRNFVLIVLMLLTIIPPHSRMLSALDFFNLLISVLCVVVIYAAANQLLRNNNAISSWRNIGE